MVIAVVVLNAASAEAALRAPGDVAFVRNGDLVVKAAGSQTAQAVPRALEEPVAWPTFGASLGNILAVQVGPADDPRVDLIEDDDFGQKTLVTGAGMPAFSDTGRLAVVARMPFEMSRVEVWDHDSPPGSDTRTIIATGRLGRPAWSPGGRRLAFASLTAAGWQVVTAIAEPDPAFVDVPVGPFLNRPDVAWSPAGDRLAVVGRRSGFADSVDVWTMRPDGGGVRRVAAGAVEGQGVTFSPDASTLMFARPGPNGTALWTVPVRGGAPIAVAVDREPGNRDGQPAWGASRPFIVTVNLRRRSLDGNAQGFAQWSKCARTVRIVALGGSRRARIVLGRAALEKGRVRFRVPLAPGASHRARRIALVQTCRGGTDGRTAYTVRASAKLARTS